MQEWGAETETVTLCAGRDSFGHRPQILVPGSDDSIDPAWAAISRCSQGDDRDDGFILYFLDHQGRALALFQFETLEILMDQAHDLAGIERDAWRACAAVVGSEGIIDVSVFAKTRDA